MNIWADLRHAFRVHFKNPKLAVLIVLTLALGIGSMTAVFTVVHSVVLRPLSYHDPDKLVRLYETNLSQDLLYFSVSPLNWMDWRANRSFEDLGVFARQQDFNRTIGEKVERISANRVSSNLFRILGSTPIQGQLFPQSSDKAGGEDVVILSFDFWNGRLGKEKQIIGKKIYLDQKAYRVVGVMGPDFRLPSNNGEIYLPLALNQKELEDRGDHFLRVIGRLKPHVQEKQALQEMRSISDALAAQYPESNKGWSITLLKLEDVVIPQKFKQASWILFGAALLVLMIACLNTANLLTAKAIGRQREIAIRRAIGASNSRVFAQLAIESLLIAMISAALGILLATWGVELLHSLEPQNIPRLQEIHVNPVVMSFAVGISLITVLFFGTLTARQSMKQDLQEGLKEGTLAATTGTARKKFRNFLVVLEAALCLVLLISAGLLMKSFLHIQDIDLGFDPDSVLALKISAPVEKYSDRLNTIHRTVLERVRSISGVQNAAISNLIPMGPGNSMIDFSTEGPPNPNLQKVFAAAYRIVSPDYFRTMKIQLMRGQYFSEKRPGKSLIIDEFTARKFWSNQEPIGQKVFITGFEGSFEIIGIVRHVKTLSIDEEPMPVIYLSNLEVPPESSIYVVALTKGNPERYGELLTKAVGPIDQNLVIAKPTPLHRVVAATLSQRRFNMIMLALFAAIALTLAATGLYSVISYSVSQRSHEIGIRMALGAHSADVVKMVVQEGLTLAVVGVLIGMIVSYASTHLLAALLYSVSPTDLFIFQSAAIFFLLIGFLSSYIPARRASHTDPLIALRYE